MRKRPGTHGVRKIDVEAALVERRTIGRQAGWRHATVHQGIIAFFVRDAEALTTPPQGALGVEPERVADVLRQKRARIACGEPEREVEHADAAPRHHRSGRSPKRAVVAVFVAAVLPGDVAGGDA